MITRPTSQQRRCLPGALATLTFVCVLASAAAGSQPTFGVPWTVVGLDLVLQPLPAGQFHFIDGERRWRAVVPGRIWIGEREVTQAQYQVMIERNPSVYRGAQRPVDNVSWRYARKCMGVVSHGPWVRSGRR